MSTQLPTPSPLPHNLPPDLRNSGLLPTHTAGGGLTYRYYVLSVLWLVALFRFVDMQIIAVLLESIRQELAFSDTQLGLIGGLAFALFYSTLGIPLAWAADRFSRRSIIAWALGLWSLMTALCGFATGFVSLFLARVGVGIGEAGAYPPSASLLADYFPPGQRPTAFAILASAVPVGVFCGFLIGGVVNATWGWRAAFICVGLPGILLALLVRYTVKELPRGCSEPVPHTGPIPESLSRSWQQLWHKHSYRFIIAGAALFTLGASGSGIWMPSYFIRHHGLEVASVGLSMALIYGGGGLLGTLFSGRLSHRLNRYCGSQTGSLMLCSLSLLLALPCAALALLGENPSTALIWLFFFAVLMHMNMGPVLNLVQNVAGTCRRAMAQAINILLANLIGLPLGPLLVGLASDRWSASVGSHVLGLAILVLVTVAWSLAAASFAFACRSLQADIDAEDTPTTEASDAASDSSVSDTGVWD